MSLIELLIVCIAILLIILFVCVYLLIRFALILIDLEDSLEQCLDILDERYRSMTEILEIPVFFDSTEVRRVINDIRLSREAIVVIANKLTEKYGRKIEIEKDENSYPS